MPDLPFKVERGACVTSKLPGKTLLHLSALDLTLNLLIMKQMTALFMVKTASFMEQTEMRHRQQMWKMLRTVSLSARNKYICYPH